MAKSSLILDGYEFDPSSFLRFLQKIGIFIHRDGNVLHIFGNGQSHQLEGTIHNYGFDNASNSSVFCPFLEHLSNFSSQIQKLEAQIASLSTDSDIPKKEIFDSKKKKFNANLPVEFSSDPFKMLKSLTPSLLPNKPRSIDKNLCLNCGRPLSSNAIFCNACGKQKDRSQQFRSL
ncbi:MAG: hypothetical protein ACFFC7_00035 [Candidatus Hermodarchaeota archaeon]